jgi:RNA polymerase sigma factor (sigma-70 family)
MYTKERIQLITAFCSLIQEESDHRHHKAFAFLLDHFSGVIYTRAYEYHHKYRYAFSHRDEAEMTALEAAYDFVRTYDVSKETADLKRALSKYVHNALERERKHVKADMERHEKDFEHQEGLISDLPEHLVDTCYTKPEGYIIQNDQRKRLVAYLACLNEDERQIIDLYYFQGMTYKEISQLSQKPLSTVACIAKRGLYKLREVMGDADEWDMAA